MNWVYIDEKFFKPIYICFMNIGNDELKLDKITLDQQ